MTEREIFKELLTFAKTSKDPRGAASACLVDAGQILFSAVSSDDGMEHAETLLCKKIKENKIVVTDDMIMYTMVEPCSTRSDADNLKDDVSEIIKCGVKCIIFGVQSPIHASAISHARMQDADIIMAQVQDASLVAEIAKTFNESLDTSRDDIDEKPSDVRS